MGLVLCGAQAGRAEHRDLALFASPVLTDSGLMRFLLPRFSLKTGVGVHVEPLQTGVVIPPGAVVLQEGRDVGQLVLRGLGRDFSVVRTGADNPAATRFADWLLSDIGQRTIAQFAPDGTPVFSGAVNAGPVADVAFLSGNARRGEGLSYTNCGRCHVIGMRNRMNGIGSTPSFALLRSFDNWRDRFEAFYTLNPHPSFSQITGVTAPFDQTRPPPISPLLLTQQELDDIIAFTDSIEPADLGVPLVHQ